MTTKRAAAAPAQRKAPRRKKPRGPGQPKFEPTAEQRKLVETLVGFGVVHADICLLIINPHSGKPISPPTLRKAFRHELAVGAIKANAKVVESLFQQISKGGKGAVVAAIWWTKCRMGWRESVQVEVSGKVKHTDARQRIADRLDEIARRTGGDAAGEGTAGDPGEPDEE